VVLVLLIGLGFVSASDTNNATQVIKDNNVLSTPSNYDVDNVVQSDLATAKSDADVEKISDTSENTNAITTNKKTPSRDGKVLMTIMNNIYSLTWSRRSNYPEW
jgi:hypothetical protein